MWAQAKGFWNRRIWAIACLCAATLVLVAATSWYILFGFNTFTLNLVCNGDRQFTLEFGQKYSEEGCRAVLRGSKFFRDGVEVGAEIFYTGCVNDEKIGRYDLYYSANFFGLKAETTRIVRVVDTRCPVISLVPDSDSIPCGTIYSDPGYCAYDNYDGDITSRVVRVEEAGRILYSVVDSSGNPARVVREIPYQDTIPPEIVLYGDSVVTLTCGNVYSDPGFFAVDETDGELTEYVYTKFDREVDWNLPGEYTLTYVVSDSSGNVVSAERTLILKAAGRRVIWPQGKVIYLTFDDGPCENTALLLDILKRYDVKATFFVVDSGYPDLLRRIVQEGHSIGIHTRSHNYHEIYQNESSYFSDLCAMQKIISDATGVKTWLMRFPGGSSNTVSCFNKGIMSRLKYEVEKRGFVYFDWNVDSGDASNATTTANVLQNMERGVSENRVSIVLQHDTHKWSVSAVESLILWAKNQGITFLPLQMDSPDMHHTIHN